MWTMMSKLNSPRSQRNCGLHPLIHTIALKKLLQNVVGKPNEAECGLKYVIHSPGGSKDSRYFRFLTI